MVIASFVESLWGALLMTLVLELGFFALVGYRKWDFLLLCAAVNTATNLALNLAVISGGIWTLLMTVEAELLVVALEYLAYALALGRSGKLFLLTLAANAISYLTGALLYGFV